MDWGWLKVGERLSGRLMGKNGVQAADPRSFYGSGSSVNPGTGA